MLDSRFWPKGFPTHWLLSAKCDFATPVQLKKIQRFASSQGIEGVPFAEMRYVSEWSGAAVEIRAEMSVKKRDVRLERHIENFGFFRSLVVASSIGSLLLLWALVRQYFHWPGWGALNSSFTWLIALLLAFFVAGSFSSYFAMRAFAVSYARELAAQFILLDTDGWETG